MDRVFRWCFSLQRTTLAFVRWRNDPEGSKLIEASKNPTDFDHNTALLEVATLLENAGLGPELVPRRPNEKTPDLNLRLSGTHVIEVEARPPEPCSFRQRIRCGSTIRRPVRRSEAAWTDASRQFTTDGILVIAGDFWVGGLDEYAAAATEILNAPLPSDASARDRRERLLGTLLASLGFKVEQRNVATALYLRLGAKSEVRRRGRLQLAAGV